MHTALAIETSRVQCGVARLLRRLPAPRRAGQGGDGDRLAVRWARRDRPRRRLGGGRVQRLSGSTSRALAARLDQLEECAACVRGLLHDEVTSFDGPLVLAPRSPQRAAAGARRSCRSGSAAAVSGARCASRPRYADGWNVPFMSPETFARKRDVLHEHCADVGRDPAEILCAVNVGLAWSEESLPRAVRGDRRLRPSRCARRVGRRGRRPHRRVRRRRRRPGQPRAARPVRPRRPRAIRRQRSALRLTAHSIEQALLLLPRTRRRSAMPRSRIASRRSSRSITSCDRSCGWRRDGAPGTSASRSAPSGSGSGSGSCRGCGRR